MLYVTLDNQTIMVNNGKFFEPETYTSYESWINKLSIDVWFVRIGYNNFKIWNLRVQKNQNLEKIAFKVIQMKFLAMHIYCFIFLQNIPIPNIQTPYKWGGGDGHTFSLRRKHLYISNASYWSKITFWYIYSRKFTKYIQGTWSLLIIYHFDPCNVLLAIATNIPQRLMTGFVVQGHLREI